MKEIDLIEILKQKFNDDNLFYYYFGIREDYFTETNIRYLNYLLGLKRPDLNLYIWNEIMNSGIDEEYFEKFDKSVFTKESLDFLNDYIKAIKCMEHTNLVNLKNTFQTDRLIITKTAKINSTFQKGKGEKPLPFHIVPNYSQSPAINAQSAA